ncbi:MAG: MFS transporter [Alicyclobacillus sp.]|nr:MFS transporter [Alicyclobacillus sp.]
MQKALVYYFSSESFLSFGIGLAGYGQPFFYQSGGLGDGRIGVLFAVNSASSGLAALLCGPVADRVGASKVFKLATALTGLSYLLTALSSGFALWLATSVLWGVAGGMLMSTENVVLSSLSAKQEKAGILSRFVSLYMLWIGLGTVAGGSVQVQFGPRATLLFGGGLALVGAAIRLLVRAPDARAHRAFRLPSRTMLWMSAYAVLFGVAIGLFRPFITLVLHGAYGLSNGWTSAVSAGTLFMVSAGSLLVSPLLRRLRHGPTLALAYALSTVVTVAMAFTRRAGPFSAALLARTALTSIPGPIIDSIFLDFTPATEYGQMFGVRVFGNSVGNAIGSYAGGGLLGEGRLATLLLVSAAVLLGAYIYLVWLLRRMGRARFIQPSSAVTVEVAE